MFAYIYFVLSVLPVLPVLFEPLLLLSDEVLFTCLQLSATQSSTISSLAVFSRFSRFPASSSAFLSASTSSYLYACEKIGRKPEECMAVEDSPNGVNAAYQAGCHVTMVPDLTPADEEVKKMADHVVPDLRGLLEYLK